MSLVVCRLPKAGLGNQMFPLMKAAVFAHLNNWPLVVLNEHQIKIGPYLRRERVKRKYRQMFRFQRSVFIAWIDALRVRAFRGPVLREPVLARVEGVRDRAIYWFEAVPHWSDFFGGLNEHRSLVIDLLWKMLHPAVIEKLRHLPPAVVGVHIRLGDFRKLSAGEDFARVGNVRTPDEYFLEVIQTIRHIHGSLLPVSIFSDGYKTELEQVLALPRVQWMEGNSDIVDLLLLSKSRLIVASAGSTFSYWAGFLSEGPLILHPDHIHRRIRLNLNSDQWYEGPLMPEHPLLTKKIKEIV